MDLLPAPISVLRDLQITREQNIEEKLLLDSEFNQKLSILLVDDSEDNRLIVKAYLKNKSHEIIEAQNGDEAVSKFTNMNFDLIFMDIQMPIMDGMTATRKIRKFEKENNRKSSVIVALTAYAQEEDEQRFMEAGCDIHLPKPIKKDAFQTVMRHAFMLMPS